MDQVHPKYGSGAPKIWIRCAQNSLKFEGAEVSMHANERPQLFPIIREYKSIQHPDHAIGQE
jgi:hypothetical protein